jgi:nucleoside-diphosphate-sugar epimerase
MPCISNCNEMTKSSMKQKILLTGAAGFTGLFFKSAAEAAGHTVWPLTADLTDKAAVAAEVAQAQPTAVVHLAAISFVGHADDAAFYSVNVLGTVNLLAALAALPVTPTKVLVASSANVYGNCDASPITEAQPPAPVNHYATSKLAMEHMALTYADRLPVVITRPFNYTGPGQAPQFLIPKLVSHFARRADRIELGNLHVEREFNDVRMVCAAYLGLLAHGQPGQVYNVCSGEPHTLQHVLATLEGITGHHMAVDVNPAFVRANEVHRLCGSPAKLLACVGSLHQPALRETLQTMLQACK